MEDKFLYQLQEVPDLEFVNNLHKKLVRNYSEPERRPFGTIFDLIKSKKLVPVTTFLAISLMALMAISPVRAFVTALITNVAGQIFEVTEDYPGDNDPGGVTTIEPQVLPLGDALAIFPHDFQLPTYIPSGYTLNEDNVRVYVGQDAGPFANSIEFEWREDDHPGLRLRVTDSDLSTGEIVAPDSIEEVFLDANHSAVLIQGGWDSVKKVWTNFPGLRLRWSVNNLVYDLGGAEREQLIEIALSTLK